MNFGNQKGGTEESLQCTLRGEQKNFTDPIEEKVKKSKY